MCTTDVQIPQLHVHHPSRTLTFIIPCLRQAKYMKFERSF